MTYFQMWNNSSSQNPNSKYQDPISPQAQKLCILQNKIKKLDIKKLDKYKINLILQITMSKWAKCKQKLIEEKLWAEKKVVYNSKLYHILIWCVNFSLQNP